MPEYTEEELRDLVRIIYSSKEDDVKEKLEPITKYLEANRYDTLTFPDFCEANEEFYEVMYTSPTDELALWVNEHDPAYEIIVKWRFTLNK